MKDSIMQIALNQAQIAFDDGEIPVGAVIANSKTKEIIAQEHNLVQTYKNPLLHAEICAIQSAVKVLNSKSLSGYDIFVTLEPCAMCASAISHARIDRLFYGASDSKHGAVENGIKFYTSKTCFHRPEIYIGIQKEFSEQLIKNFFVQARNLLRN